MLLRLPSSALIGCAAIFVDFMGLSVIVPLLPHFVTKPQIGQIVTGQYAAVVVGQILIGALSDVFGVRTMVVVVMVSDAALFVATGFSKDVGVLLPVRAAVGLAAPTALGVTYVSKYCLGLPPGTVAKTFTKVGIAFNVGILVGGIAGGILGPGQWRVANCVSGAVAAAVGLWAFLAESPTETARKRQLAADTNRKELKGDDNEIQKTESNKSEVSKDDTERQLESGKNETSKEDDNEKSKLDGQTNVKQNIKAIFSAFEHNALLMAFITQGLFQGANVSLMPVILTSIYERNAAAAPNQEEIISLNLAIAIIFGCTTVLQIISNLTIVKPLLLRFGNHKYMAYISVVMAATLVTSALLLLPLLESFDGASDYESPASTTLIAVWCAVYCVSYVFSASTLTVANLLSSAYARKYNAPVGFMNGLGRGVFSLSFCVAPVASIALGTPRPWLPYILLSVFAVVTCAMHAYVVLRGDPNVIGGRAISENSRN